MRKKKKVTRKKSRPSKKSSRKATHEIITVDERVSLNIACCEDLITLFGVTPVNSDNEYECWDSDGRIDYENHCWIFSGSTGPGGGRNLERVTLIVPFDMIEEFSVEDC